MPQAISKMETTQTAVEWSIDQMIALCEDYDDGKINYTHYINGVKEVKSQAKTMEKEQIIDAATWGYLAETGEQYYKEKYKQ